MTNSQLLHFGLWGATGMHECIHAECRIRSVHVQREKLRWILTQITTFSSEVNFQLSILNLFYLEKNKKHHTTSFLYLWLSWPTSAPSCASGCSVVRRSTRPSPSPSSLWPCARGVPASRGHSAQSLTGFWRGTQTD